MLNDSSPLVNRSRSEAKHKALIALNTNRVDRRGSSWIILKPAVALNCCLMYLLAMS